MATQPHDTAPGAPRRPVVAGAVAAHEMLAGCAAQRVWELTDDGVREAMVALGHVAAGTESVMVAVLAEARRRGISTSEGWSPVDWAKSAAPLLSTRAVLDLDRVAAAADQRRLAGVMEAVAQGSSADRGDADPLPVGKAAQIVRFHEGVRTLAEATLLADVTETLLESARGAGGLSERHLAVAVRHAADLMREDIWTEKDAEVRRSQRSLVKGAGPMGMWRYTMLLDDEGAALVDAAVDALAKPQPTTDPETGVEERDPRSPATRRADALLELVRRAVGAPEGVPRQAKTQLVVTMGFAALAEQCRGAGLTPDGEMLTAGTVRRLACDAQIIPVVLGSRGEVLDQGQAIRLFNRAQIRHLWMRDRHCTFPGCSRPAAWSDAHHLLHWADAGPTDIWNAALLCQAHHTVVHRNRFAGRVVDGPNGPHVVWDLARGSYDLALAAWEAAGRPPLRPAAAATASDNADGGDSILGPPRR